MRRLVREVLSTARGGGGTEWVEEGDVGGWWWVWGEKCEGGGWRGGGGWEGGGVGVGVGGGGGGVELTTHIYILCCYKNPNNKIFRNLPLQ